MFLVIDMKRNDGYLVLDNANVIDKIPRNNGGEAIKFLIDGQEFYFKECDEVHSLLEIFCGYVAKFVDIPTVMYDLATYQNRKGVLSSSYNPYHLKEITLYEIFTHYYISCLVSDEELCDDLMHFDDLFNLEDIWNALDFYYQDNPRKNEIVEILMEDVINAFFLQIFLGNRDVHYTQLTILESDNPRLSMNHDYGESCLIQMHNNFYSYALQSTMHDTLHKVQPKDTIYDFFTSTDESFISKFEEKLSLIPSKDVILNFMREQLGIEVSESRVSFFLKNYDSYKLELQNILMLKRYQ